MVDIKFQKAKVKNFLRTYLFKTSSYDNFDREQNIILYLRSTDNDFVAFESCEFTLGFISSCYKVSDFFILEQENNLSKYRLTFNQFAELVA